MNRDQMRSTTELDCGPRGGKEASTNIRRPMKDGAESAAGVNVTAAVH
jgi:hypothetical protein